MVRHQRHGESDDPDRVAQRVADGREHELALRGWWSGGLRALLLGRHLLPLRHGVQCREPGADFNPNDTTGINAFGAEDWLISDYYPNGEVGATAIEYCFEPTQQGRPTVCHTVLFARESKRVNCVLSVPEKASNWAPSPRIPVVGLSSLTYRAPEGGVLRIVDLTGRTVKSVVLSPRDREACGLTERSSLREPTSTPSRSTAASARPASSTSPTDSIVRSRLPWPGLVPTPSSHRNPQTMSSIRSKEALDYHSRGRRGKVEVIPSKPYSSQRDLSLAYSPGVAEPCLEISKNREDVYKYTAKGNLVAVISNGTAVSVWVILALRRQQAGHGRQGRSVQGVR